MHDDASGMTAFIPQDTYYQKPAPGPVSQITQGVRSVASTAEAAELPHLLGGASSLPVRPLPITSLGRPVARAVLRPMFSGQSKPSHGPPAALARAHICVPLQS